MQCCPGTPELAISLWLLKPEYLVGDLLEWYNQVPRELQSQEHRLIPWATVLEGGS